MSLTFEPSVAARTAATKQDADYILVNRNPWNVLLALVSLGFSGTNILRLNQTANRFWMVLTVASIIFLSYSLISFVQSLNLECELNISPDAVAVECMERVTGSAVEGS